MVSQQTLSPPTDEQPHEDPEAKPGRGGGGNPEGEDAKAKGPARVRGHARKPRGALAGGQLAQDQAEVRF